MANYHLLLEDYLYKVGWSGNNQHDDRVGWKRVHGLIKQYKKLGFKNVTLERVYTREKSKNADSETICVERVTHVLMGAAGRHIGDQEKHGIGWTEIFAVSKNQLIGYFGKAIQICKRLNWNIKAIEEWLKNYCLKHFKVESWTEYVVGNYGTHPNRPNIIRGKRVESTT